MRTAYRVFAYLIAVEVVVQAAVIAYGVFGLGKWIDDGHVVTKHNADSGSITGSAGFVIHAVNGELLVPLLAIVLLILSLFARVPGGVKWAGLILLLVVVQVALGLLSHAVPGLGALHGIDALAIFGVAAVAGYRVPRHRPADSRPAEQPSGTRV